MGTALDAREIQAVLGEVSRAPSFNPLKDVVEGYVYDTHVGANVTKHPRRAAIVAVKATNVILKCYCGRMYSVRKKDKHGWFACSAKCALRWYPDREAARLKAYRALSAIAAARWAKIPDKQTAWYVGYWKGFEAGTHRWLNILKGLTHVLTVAANPRTTRLPKRRSSSGPYPPTPPLLSNPYWPQRGESPSATPSSTEADDTRA